MIVRGKVGGVPVRLIKPVPSSPGSKAQVIVETLERGYVGGVGPVRDGERIVIEKHRLKLKP